MTQGLGISNDTSALSCKEIYNSVTSDSPETYPDGEYYISLVDEYGKNRTVKVHIYLPTINSSILKFIQI